jgi:uncharacterized Zn finger protein (UPF0148 family)
MTPTEGTCPNCGAPLPVGATACERCGASVVSANSAATVPVSKAFSEPAAEKNMETVRVDANEVPPEYLSSAPAPEPATPLKPTQIIDELPAQSFEPVAPAFESSTPPPPAKKDKKGVIIAVVVLVAVCLCVCVCGGLGYGIYKVLGN